MNFLDMFDHSFNVWVSECTEISFSQLLFLSRLGEGVKTFVIEAIGYIVVVP
jgi:hypothetical protein